MVFVVKLMRCVICLLLGDENRAERTKSQITTKKKKGAIKKASDQLGPSANGMD